MHLVPRCRVRLLTLREPGTKLQTEGEHMTRFGIGLFIVVFLIVSWALAVTLTGNLSQWLSKVLP